MRIALCADEPYPIHAELTALLQARGHEVVPFGAVATGTEAAWAPVAEAAALMVADGRCDEGIFLCWTGTGVAMAANKIPGIRAALCADPGAAAGARIWNHANVLCLAHRTLAVDFAREILDAWFDTAVDPRGDSGVAQLDTLDRRYRRQVTEDPT